MFFRLTGIPRLLLGKSSKADPNHEHLTDEVFAQITDLETLTEFKADVLDCRQCRRRFKSKIIDRQVELERRELDTPRKGTH